MARLDPFFDRYDADAAAGQVQPLEVYQGLWPELADEIARIFAEASGVSQDPGSLRPVVVASVPENFTVLGPETVTVRDEEVRRFGPYRIQKLLGSGGMGQVYLAEQERPRRLVALKVLRRERMTPAMLRRFEQEAELLGRIQHPGIAQVFAAGRAPDHLGGAPYIAMQYVPGETLADRIRRHDTTGRSETREERSTSIALMASVARAVHAAHEAGVVHRDIKPGNIVVTPDGRPVVLDFGIARDVSGDATTLTQEGAVPGTPFYMSPEQMRSDGVDHQTDVWSLGVTLYELLTGRRPFQGATYDDLRLHILRREPVLAFPGRTTRERDLRVVIQTALSKEKSRRYQSALALAEDLDAVARGVPIAARPISRMERAVRWVRREPTKAALMAVLGIGLPTVTALSWHYWTTREDLKRAENQRILDEREQRLERAWFDLGDGARNDALRLFDGVLSEDPGSVEAAAGRALAALYSNDVPLMMATLDAYPTRPDPLQRLRVAGLRTAGEEDLARSLESTLPPPQEPLDYFLSGCLKFRALGDDLSPQDPGYAECVDHLTRAILGSPRARAFYYFELSRVVGRAMDRTRGDQVASAIVALWPESPLGLARAAQCWTLVGAEPKKARAAAQEAARRLPNNAGVHTNLSLALERAGDYERSADAARRALALDAGVVNAWANLATALWRLGRLDEAAEAGLKAVDVPKPDAAALGTLGLIRLGQGRLDEAEARFRQALEIKPGVSQLHSNLGLIAGRRKKYDEAIAHYEEALRLKPDLPEALAGLGQLYRHIGRRGESVDAYRRAVAAAPWWAAIQSTLGDVLREAGRLEEAREVLEQTVVRFPDHPDGHCNLGHVLSRLGYWRDALPHFEKGHALGSQKPDWRYPSERWVKECEQKAAVEGLWPQIRDGSAPWPEDSATVVFLGRLVHRRGDFPFALRCWSRVEERDPEGFADVAKGYRYDAACAALREAGALEDSPERASLVTRACDWLQADLRGWRARWEAGRVRETDLKRKLSHWEADPDLAGLRPPFALLGSESERRPDVLAWWAEIRKILEQLP